MRRCVRGARSAPPNRRQGGRGGRHPACHNQLRVAGADVHGTETDDREDSKSLGAGPRPRFNSAHPQPLSASVSKSAFTRARLWIDAYLLSVPSPTSRAQAYRCLNHNPARSLMPNLRRGLSVRHRSPQAHAAPNARALLNPQPTRLLHCTPTLPRGRRSSDEAAALHRQRNCSHHRTLPRTTMPTSPLRPAHLPRRAYG